MELKYVVLIINLTDQEKSALLESLEYIRSNKIETFVINFYENFLNKDTLQFLKQSSNEELINMFTSFFNIIFTHLQYPELLEEHMNILFAKNPKFNEFISYSDEFVTAFMKSLVTSLEKQYSDQVYTNWSTTLLVYVDYISRYST